LRRANVGQADVFEVQTAEHCAVGELSHGRLGAAERAGAGGATCVVDSVMSSLMKGCDTVQRADTAPECVGIIIMRIMIPVALPLQECAVYKFVF